MVPLLNIGLKNLKESYCIGNLDSTFIILILGPFAKITVLLGFGSLNPG